MPTTISKISAFSQSVLDAFDALFGAPVGSVLSYDGVRLPNRYMWRDGSTLNRADYPKLFEALTIELSATLIIGESTITVSEDIRNLGLAGKPIEGVGIPPGTTITAINETSLGLSAAVTASAVGSSVRIFPHGNGNGTTTFTLPDGRGRTDVGRDDMGGTAANRITSSGAGNPGINGARLGAAGGTDRHQLTIAQMPQHRHGTPRGGNVRDPGTSGDPTSVAGPGAGNTEWTGGDEAHPNVQPSLITNKIIKVR